MSHLTMKGNDTVSEIMRKMAIRALIAAALLAALCGMTAGTIARADEGKNLTHMPMPAAPAIPGECNRECLYGFVDKFFSALESRWPGNMPLAPEVKYTENEVPVALGEGIWKTFSGRGTYRVYLADPASGEVGYYGNYTEFAGALDGVIVVRMKVKDHRVTELQTIEVREQKRPKGGLGLNTAGIMTPRTLDELSPKGFVSPDAALLAPLGSAETREQLVGATKGYFDAYAQSKGSSAPFDAKCMQRQNGFAATNNADGPAPDKAQASFHMFSEGCAGELDRGYLGGIEKVRDARPLVVDEKQGLVLDLAFFDNQGDVKSVAVTGVGDVTVPVEYRRAFSFMAPRLFKIEGGKIREIEGVSWAVPFGMHPAEW